jgi:prepilin-type N-terminal cleavage/methylation domain-containing protein
VSQFYLSLGRHGSLRAQNHALLGLAKAPPRFLQTGFSLLELIVVVALLSIVALSATTLIIDNGDLKRQEATETRWNQLHDAIISQPNLYLNGSPYVRGYVADMGRLPVSILELVRQSELAETYDEDNNAGTVEITIDQPDWTDINLGYTANAENGYVDTLAGGWRGPYLYTAGSQQFRDGWGREDPDLGQDVFTFGWIIDTDGEQRAQVLDLLVQSYGSDQELGGIGDFTEDFPVNANIPNDAIVSENEWMLSAAPITFNINFSNAIRAVPTATQPITLPPNGIDGNPQALQLRIYRYQDDGDNAANINDLYTQNADATFTVADGASAATTTITPQDADFTAAPAVRGLPIGRYAALIWCTNNNNPATPADDTVYDGDCNQNNPLTAVDHSPVYFTLTNNTSQVTLTWDLP